MFDDLKQVVKPLAEKGLVFSGLPRAARTLNSDTTAILVYHNVIPANASAVGDSSLHLARGRFAAELDLLTETHRVVSLDEFTEGRPTAAAGSRPKALVTFDDAYRGALTIGLEELGRRGLPCTIFVAPERLGDQSLWWDELAEAVGPAHSRYRSEVLRACEGRGESARQWLRQQGLECPTLPDYARTVAVGELAQSVAPTRVTIGSHTWSHPHLPNLALSSTKALEEELVKSRDWLAEHFPETFRPWLAYPYGAATKAVYEKAEEYHYEHAVVTKGGLCGPDVLEDRPFTIPRINIAAGLSIRGFQLRTAGLFLT